MLAFTLKNGSLCQVEVFSEDSIDEVLQIEQKVSISPWSRQNFLDSVSSSHLCYAAYLESRVVGFSIFSCAAGEAELLLLAVDPQYHRQGIAQGLLSELLELLSQRAQEVFLEVRESNTQAIALYEMLDFNCIGRRHAYYPAGPAKNGKAKGREDALIYAKHIAKTYS